MKHKSNAIASNFADVADLVLMSGVHVIPVDPETKHPPFKEWQTRATNNLQVLETWWKKWPDALIGVTTGELSGLWAIDIDFRSGGKESLAALIVAHGALPDTARYETPGGYRYCFRWPKAVTIKSRGGDIAPGIDVRGGTAGGLSKGQIVVPPGVRADGGRYEWGEREGLHGAVDAPAWLLFLAIFNARERKALAAIGVTGPDGFNGLPASTWHTEALQRLKSAKERPTDRKLSAGDMDRLEGYVRRAVGKVCEALGNAVEGTRQTAIGNAALAIHSLLKGLELKGGDSATLEEWAYERWIAATESLGEGEHTAEDPQNRWDRCRDDADPRDLSGKAGTDPLEEFADLSGDVDLAAWADRRAKGAGEPEGSPAPAAASGIIKATPYVRVDPSSIMPRDWLYGRHLVRKFVSATVAPGGIGKSSLVLVEALSIVTGRGLLIDRAPGPGRVWWWNGEDPFDELQRRIEAVCLRYGIAVDATDGRLFVDSGRTTPIVIATETKHGATIAEPVVSQVKATIRENGIDVFIVDPFVSCHRVSENDNNKIEAVAWEWAKIADECDCAIELVHHSRKTNGAEVTAEDSRGASR